MAATSIFFMPTQSGQRSAAGSTALFFMQLACDRDGTEADASICVRTG
jgi:hypothetical protein